MELLVVISALLLGGAVALAGRAVVFGRIRIASRLEGIAPYGFGADRSADGDVPETRVQGVARRVGDLTADRLTRVEDDDKLRRELMAAGMYRTSPRALLGYRALSALVLPSLLLWLASGHVSPAVAILLAAASVAGGWMLPVTYVRRRAHVRKKKVDREVPEFIDLLVVTVETGQGLAGALQIAGGRLRGPLGDEVRLAVQEQAMGLSTHEALSNMVARTDTPALRSFVRSVIQGESLGVSIGDVLRAIAVDMRKRRRQAAEEQAQKAPIKMLFPLAFCIFPSMFIVILGPSVFKTLDTLGNIA
jgi:tight adherence protein C